MPGNPDGLDGTLGADVEVHRGDCRCFKEESKKYMGHARTTLVAIAGSVILLACFFVTQHLPDKYESSGLTQEEEQKLERAGGRRTEAKQSGENAEEFVPTEAAARELVREFIAEKTGTPVNRYQPMQCVYVRQTAAANGKVYWQADFLSYGHAIVANGHGQTVVQVLDGLNNTVYFGN